MVKWHAYSTLPLRSEAQADMGWGGCTACGVLSMDRFLDPILDALAYRHPDLLAELSRTPGAGQ